MMKPKHKRILLTTVRILLGLVFLASGIGKLINGSEAQYLVELLATEFYWLIEYSSLIVTVTSVLELAIAVFLLWGRYLKWALGGALLMLVGFSSVLSYFYLQGMSVENCGCFGALGFASGLEFTLLRNGVLVLLVIGAYILSVGAREKAV
ncbi:MauE/DoxX family redox-associated membrane protein [Fodinibius sp.]|uniref:MauE/DoxX family redox-associated membrane protein n=1 Tax=Fodinibius sp. TaxID=1872440 RepID=UPI003567422F